MGIVQANGKMSEDQLDAVVNQKERRVGAILLC